MGPVDFYVYDFCIYHDTLYLTGEFEHVGDLECLKIAAYTGEEWLNVGDLGHWSKALAVFNDELYAGGFWGVKRYLGGDEWELFDIVPNGYVNELTVDTINSFLFVGGQFFAIGEEDSWGSAIWDGFSWVSMGTSVAGTTVYSQASAMYRGEYYVGNGISTLEDGIEIFVKKWNGVAWDSIGGCFNDAISAIEVFRDTLYIGGGFTYWGGNSPVPDKRNKGLVKLYMPDNGCDYLKPRINTWADTVYLEGGEAELNFYNNNPYANSWEWDFTSTGSVTIPGSSERNPVVTFTEPGEYDVQVIVTQDGCVKTAEKTVWVLLSDDIENFSSPGQIKMQVFPNPSSNGFTVKTSLTSYKNVQIKIAGLNGHLKDIIPVTNETTLISTKGWKPGTYVCNLFVDGRFVKAEKLVFE